MGAASLDTELLSLVDLAWGQHTAARGQPWLVAPSAPILFFGDLHAYRKSPLRVITVALNPSDREFPKPDPFCRFKACTGPEAPAASDYISALNRYFRAIPYRGWFDFYEQGLNGLDASYYGDAEATALHTDIASCLATSPTWSGLPDEVQERLAPGGISLWHRLITYLDPQVVLWSTARRWLARIECEPLSDWMQLYSFAIKKDGRQRVQPLNLEARWYRVGLTPTLIGFAPAAQKPFGSLSHDQKREVGRRLMEHWNDGVPR
jgi:hypothetical protein